MTLCDLGIWFALSVGFSAGGAIGVLFMAFLWGRYEVRTKERKWRKTKDTK